MTSQPSPGIYDRLLDQDLTDLLARYPELRPLFGKLEAEEQPSRYAEVVSQVLRQSLLEEPDPERRRVLCNRIIDLLSGPAGTERKAHLENRKLVQDPKPVLLEITPPHYAGSGMPRPRTSMVESSLFTGSPREPQLVQELLEEMRSADAVDILVSFIKWSGLRLLMPGFEDLKDRRVPVRLITTSYMGASDVPAIEWLAGELPNARIRISYDSRRTRLHAKAWHFRRDSGFSTAYIGSANMSHAAMTSGLEWNLKVTSQDLGHILEKFSAEFETYWHSREFLPYDPADPVPFRQAIERARKKDGAGPAVFFDLQPHPFQERILEKLLCPFHYFGVTDPVDISKDHFWRNGRYDDRALEKVYTGDDILAKMRVDTIVRALDRYEPARETIKGVGFCVTIRHARFMADAFNRHGIASAAYVSGVDRVESQGTPGTGTV